MKMKMLLFCLNLLVPIQSFAQEDSLEAATPNSKRPDLSQLTTEEIRTYQYGEISTGSLIGGGLLGTFVGLGFGHIVYGEYGSKGWIFTVSELGSLGIMTAGLSQAAAGCTLLNTSSCSNGLGLYTFGAFAYFGLRIWEIVDVWTLPSRHNGEYRAIQSKLGISRARTEWQVLPMIGPAAGGRSTYGLSLAMTF